MFLFWMILGTLMILLGIFNRRILRLFGFRAPSEVMTTPNLKISSRLIEQIGRWLAIALGMSFLVLGLGRTVSADISSKIMFALLGLSGLMLLAIIGITIASWRGK